MLFHAVTRFSGLFLASGHIHAASFVRLDGLLAQIVVPRHHFRGLGRAFHPITHFMTSNVDKGELDCDSVPNKR